MTLTKKDIAVLEERFVTKPEFIAFKDAMLKFRQDTQSNFEFIFGKLLNLDKQLSALTKFQMDSQSNFEFVFGKLNKMDDELTAFLSLYRRHDDKLEDHEKRITKLEAVPA
jgi:hypothetical protein